MCVCSAMTTTPIPTTSPNNTRRLAAYSAASPALRASKLSTRPPATCAMLAPTPNSG